MRTPRPKGGSPISGKLNMKALTVRQPFAREICLPDHDERRRRVLNKRRLPHDSEVISACVPGPLAIHAGKSLLSISRGDSLKWPDMTFGAVVAVCEFSGGFRPSKRMVSSNGVFVNGRLVPGELYTVDLSEDILKEWPWLASDRHPIGPACWVIENVFALPDPVKCDGKRGLWDLPKAVEAAVLEQIGDRYAKEEDAD